MFSFSKSQDPARIAQHFLYFKPLPHGQGSLRLAMAGLDRGAGGDEEVRLTSRSNGSRLCRKKRFSPAQR